MKRAWSVLLLFLLAPVSLADDVLLVTLPYGEGITNSLAPGGILFGFYTPFAVWSEMVGEGSIGYTVTLDDGHPDFHPEDWRSPGQVAFQVTTRVPMLGNSFADVLDGHPFLFPTKHVPDPFAYDLAKVEIEVTAWFSGWNGFTDSHGGGYEARIYGVALPEISTGLLATLALPTMLCWRNRFRCQRSRC
jgi:hypothetical protein